jgi:hypothetical protein
MHVHVIPHVYVAIAISASPRRHSALLHGSGVPCMHVHACVCMLALAGILTDSHTLWSAQGPQEGEALPSRRVMLAAECTCFVYQPCPACPASSLQLLGLVGPGAAGADMDGRRASEVAHRRRAVHDGVRRAAHIGSSSGRGPARRGISPGIRPDLPRAALPPAQAADWVGRARGRVGTIPIAPGLAVKTEGSSTGSTIRRQWRRRSRATGSARIVHALHETMGAGLGIRAWG